MQKQSLRLAYGAAIAIAAALGASAVIAGTVDIATYNGYSDNGSGMTFSGPVTATGSVNSPSTGFDYNWDNPGSVGGYNSGDVFSADFKGVLDATGAGTYIVNFGSDDAGYVFINGALAISDGGAHSTNIAPYMVTLNAGANNFEIQYGNVFCCGAEVVLDTVSPGVSVGSVPEPATWALLLAGVGMVGAGVRFSRKADLNAAAA